MRIFWRGCGSRGMRVSVAAECDAAQGDAGGFAGEAEAGVSATRVRCTRHLPAAGLQQVLLGNGGGGEAFHGSGDGFAGFGDDLGVVEVVVAMTMARARETASSRSMGLFSTSSGVARSFMKMPEPTKTDSAPSCIIRAASAGVAMPPAEKLGTGSEPVLATMRTSS